MSESWVLGKERAGKDVEDEKCVLTYDREDICHV